jgi:hypothetical protein
MEVKKTLLLAVLQSALVGLLGAQTTPAGFTPSTLYVGAEPSSANPDWGCPKASPFSCWNYQLLGVQAYVGKNQVWRRFGAEADVRWLNGRGNLTGLRESNYVAGPTYRLIGNHNFVVTANVLVGLGAITIPAKYDHGQSGNFFIYSPAVHLEQHLAREFFLRYEYEYQSWPGFTGLHRGSTGLSPSGFGLGITYRLHSNRSVW